MQKTKIKEKCCCGRELTRRDMQGKRIAIQCYAFESTSSKKTSTIAIFDLRWTWRRRWFGKNHTIKHVHNNKFARAQVYVEDTLLITTSTTKKDIGVHRFGRRWKRTYGWRTRGGRNDDLTCKSSDISHTNTKTSF